MRYLYENILKDLKRKMVFIGDPRQVARLDVYRWGGDSLLGRYHYWRLHPFGHDEYPNKMTPK